MSTTTSHSPTIKQGVDLDKFEDFVEYAAAHPDEVKFGLEASGEYEGRAAHTTATTRAYTLGGNRIDRPEREYTRRFGAHREVEQALGFVDPVDREEVIEAALAALTGCINTAVTTAALVRGIDLDGLTTKVRVGWDPLVFLHVDDVEANGEATDQFDDLEIELIVSGEALDSEAIEYLERSIRRSAVYNLVTLAHRAVPKVRVAA